MAMCSIPAIVGEIVTCRLKAISSLLNELSQFIEPNLEVNIAVAVFDAKLFLSRDQSRRVTLFVKEAEEAPRRKFRDDIRYYSFLNGLTQQVFFNSWNSVKVCRYPKIADDVLKELSVFGGYLHRMYRILGLFAFPTGKEEPVRASVEGQGEQVNWLRSALAFRHRAGGDAPGSCAGVMPK